MEPDVINMAHNMQSNVSQHGSAQQKNTAPFVMPRVQKLAEQPNKLNYNQMLTADYSRSAPKLLISKVAQWPVYKCVLLLRILLFILILCHLCLRLQMKTPPTTITIKMTSRTRGTMMAMLPRGQTEDR